MSCDQLSRSRRPLLLPPLCLRSQQSLHELQALFQIGDPVGVLPDVLQTLQLPLFRIEQPLLQSLGKGSRIWHPCTTLRSPGFDPQRDGRAKHEERRHDDRRSFKSHATPAQGRADHDPPDRRPCQVGGRERDPRGPGCDRHRGRTGLPTWKSALRAGCGLVGNRRAALRALEKGHLRPVHPRVETRATLSNLSTAARLTRIQAAPPGTRAIAVSRGPGGTGIAPTDTRSAAPP